MKNDPTRPVPGTVFGRNKWAVLGMLWIVCLLNYADRQAITSVFPLLEGEFGFSKAELGLIGASFMWVYAVSAPFAGYAGDRLSRKSLILGGCLFWSILTGVTGFCGRVWQFVAARSLIGLGESFYFPSAVSMLSDYHGRRTRSTALAFHQSAVYVGTIAGGALGALLAERCGWRWAFYGFGVAGIALSLFLRHCLCEPARGAADHGVADEDGGSSAGMVRKAAELLGKPGVLPLMLAFACANGVAAIFLIWAPTFLYEKFHLGLVEAGFSAVAVIQLSSAASAPLAGMLSDRLALTLRGARMLVQAAALLPGALCVAAVGHAGTTGVLLTAMMLFGLCKGAYDAGIFASVFDLVDPGERAFTAGIMNMIGWGGGALGPVLVGMFSSRGTAGSAEGMSSAISWSAAAYLLAVSLIVTAFLRGRGSIPNG